ncbi:MAG: hypothetical protein SGPRY_012746, partial [Prymnesium sp.]
APPSCIDSPALPPPPPPLPLVAARPTLRALGTATTLYADRNDWLLSLSELLNCQRSLGRLWEWPPRGGRCDLRGGSGKAQMSECDDLDIVETTHLMAGLPSGSPDLSTNTGLRHALFSVNQLMVDDLMELLIHGRRAEDRTSHLRCCGGRLYRFIGV